MQYFFIEFSISIRLLTVRLKFYIKNICYKWSKFLFSGYWVQYFVEIFITKTCTDKTFADNLQISDVKLYFKNKRKAEQILRYALNQEILYLNENEETPSFILFTTLACSNTLSCTVVCMCGN